MYAYNSIHFSLCVYLLIFPKLLSSVHKNDFAGEKNIIKKIKRESTKQQRENERNNLKTAATKIFCLRLNDETEIPSNHRIKKNSI